MTAIVTCPLFFLLSLSTFFAAITAQQKNSTISLTSSLSPISKNNSWLSNSGRFAFGFYPERNGFLIGVWFIANRENTVIWTANRDDSPLSSNVTLLFTNDGRLVLRPFEGQDKTIADPSSSASSASMLDSGNFVIYNSDLNIIWQSFDSPTDTLLPGQHLLDSDGKNQLYSSVSASDHSTGRFRLIMQQDGHLVQYPIQTPNTATYAYWASGTNGQGPNVSLNLDDDGHLYLLNSTGYNIKDLSKGGLRSNRTIFYRLTQDFDGIFRLYMFNNGDWSRKWNSSSDACSPKGLCGLNGYCILNDQEFDCLCITGFDYIDPGQRTSGCQKNFTDGTCGSKREDFNYSMNPVDSVTWEDDPYDTISSTDEDDCKKTCLDDCTCEAAVFKDGVCKKQKLPLRYGRRQVEDLTKTFVKVSNGGILENTKDAPITERGDEDDRKKELRFDILIIGVVLAICALIVLAISGVLIYRYRVWAYEKTKDQPDIELTEEIALKSFTYAELEKATENFKEEVGSGAFGTVFKGKLSNGRRLIAVKKLEKVIDEGEREFRTEMKVIGRTHHRNLVRLLGYCLEQSNRLLVYEYMSNGSLADLLFKPEGHPNWDERVGIAMNIARGILYLHEECVTQIIHCDIKPQNILMDDHLCAKICDFGLAKLLKHDQTKTFTGIRGTRGYVAPEWHRNMPITVKADVFSFGIVLLEIICCRRSVDMNLPEEEVVLSDWVYDCFDGGETYKLVGEEEVDGRKLERMVRVAIWCIQEEPSMRPSMKKVVLMLEGTVEVPIPPSPSSYISAI